MAMYLVSFGVTQALGIGTKCFIEGTLILTSVGLVKIEDIKEGDEVWSYNEETKEKELKKVKRLFRNKTKEWLHLTIINEETKTEEEIICTKNHRIYIKNKGWIEANEILENEEVLLYNNVIGKVIRKELENLTYEETTYNFEVEDNHNYYVGEECVLVHNDCTPGNSKNYSPEEIAQKYNISVDDYHRKVKPKILSKSKPNHKVGKNPNIMLTKTGDIGYQGANGKMFQDAKINIIDIIKELDL